MRVILLAAGLVLAGMFLGRWLERRQLQSALPDEQPFRNRRVASQNLAELVVEALIEAELIERPNSQRAVRVAAQEIGLSQVTEQQ